MANLIISILFTLIIIELAIFVIGVVLLSCAREANNQELGEAIVLKALTVGAVVLILSLPIILIAVIGGLLIL